MLTLPPAVRIYVATAPCDLRKQFDGLAALVAQGLQEDPRSGHLYVFRNQRGSHVRILFWDRSGYCLVSKRLEKAPFACPGAPRRWPDERTWCWRRRNWRCCWRASTCAERTAGPGGALTNARALRNHQFAHSKNNLRGRAPGLRRVGEGNDERSHPGRGSGAVAAAADPGSARGAPDARYEPPGAADHREHAAAMASAGGPAAAVPQEVGSGVARPAAAVPGTGPCR